MQQPRQPAEKNLHCPRMGNMETQNDDIDVLVIGAGPSGAIAAALLVQKGYKVRVLERETFPRFSIGESMLPQIMAFVEEAGMMEAVQAGGFQLKNGAAFLRGDEYTTFDFSEKTTPGWGTTFQVQRARFDKILADEAARFGADVRYRHEITAVDVSGERPVVEYRDPDGNPGTLSAKFLLDASGYGRVLPRLLDLHVPSTFPVRQACFTHIQDNISADWFDRNKILITVHNQHRDVWFWLIPFADGTSSFGVVGEKAFLDTIEGEREEKLFNVLKTEGPLAELLANAKPIMPGREMIGYSAGVKSLVGNNFALLGNAGEFLDPVFSSGVTVAMKSASLAANLLDRQFKGEVVDWHEDFAVPLKQGVDAFRVFVTSWYDERFQDIIFHHTQLETVKKMICSVLAGYAWDRSNPFVKDGERKVNVLAEICRAG
jgi:flavin-dependent dehydrogenase